MCYNTVLVTDKLKLTLSSGTMMQKEHVVKWIFTVKANPNGFVYKRKIELYSEYYMQYMNY